MKPSKLFRDALASCLWSAPVFGILWYVRLTHGRDAMYDVFAAITAWGILAALIFAFRGEGSTPDDRSLEGPGEGFSWFGCLCGWRYIMPFKDGEVECPRCGQRFEWKDFGRTSITDPIQAQAQSQSQSEYGDNRAQKVLRESGSEDGVTWCPSIIEGRECTHRKGHSGYHIGLSGVEWNDVRYPVQVQSEEGESGDE